MLVFSHASSPVSPGSAGIQESPGFVRSRESNEGEDDELVFRGIILRHQLVSLLKNKVFFNEGDGVRKYPLSGLIFDICLCCSQNIRN